MRLSLKVSRVHAAFLGSPRAGGLQFLILQLALIVSWHAVVFWAVSALPLRWLAVASSRFWYALGLTSSYMGPVGTVVEEAVDIGGVELVLMYAGLLATPLVAEGLVAWIVFRRTLQQRRPRFHRFVRYWWRAWLYGTVWIPTAAVLVTLLPSPLGPALRLPTIALYVVLAPTGIAKWERARRARRVAKKCAVCGYCLRGNVSGRCPECGSPAGARDSHQL